MVEVNPNSNPLSRFFQPLVDESATETARGMIYFLGLLG
jgi:hypothetical protein